MVIGFVMMGSDLMSLVRISCKLFLMFLVGCTCVRADFEQDKKECKDQIVAFSPCLAYISGEEKAPSSSCCIRLIQHYNESRKCLCTLVKDRDDPRLGFKINATVALKLPSICNVPANATKCLDLLHLDPQSPEAQIFKQSSNGSASGSSATSSDTGLPKSTTSKRMHKRRWLTYGMAGGVSIWLLMSSSIISF